MRRRTFSLLPLLLLLLAGESLLLPAAARGSDSFEAQRAGLLDLLELTEAWEARARHAPSRAEEVLAAALDHPSPRALPRARALEALRRWELGDVDGALAMQQQAGLVTRWAIVGPFPNEGMAGFRAPGPLEQAPLDLEAPLPGRGGEVTWQRDVPLSDAAVLRVHERVQPAESSWAYAVADLRSPIAQPVRLLIGVSGAWRLWVNGQPVAGREARYATGIGAEEVDVHLIGGRNRVVFQIAVEDELPELALQVVHRSGGALPAVEAIAVEGDSFTPLAAPGVLPAPRRSAAILHRQLRQVWGTERGGQAAGSEGATRAADAGGSGARDSAGGAQESAGGAQESASGAQEGAGGAQESAGGGLPPDVLAALARLDALDAPEDPTTPWQSWREAALAARATLDARTLLHLAQSARTGWEALGLLDEARAKDGGNEDVRLAWVEAKQGAMGGDHLAEAVAVLFESAAAVPERALVLNAEQLWRATFHYRALARLLEGVEDFDASTRRLHLARHYARELRRDDLQPTLIRLIWERQRDDLIAAADLVDVLRVLGDARGIARVLASLLELRPNDTQVLLLHAEQARVDEDLEGALRWTELAHERCPGCAGPLEERGRLLLRLGQREEARASFAAALERAPQRSLLRDYLERLDESPEPALESAWRIDDDTLRSMREALGTPDESLSWLVDQRLVQVFPNGLSRSWNQRAAVAHTRSGVDQIRSFSLTYTPGSEEVEVRSVRILRPDGSVREGWESSDRSMTSGPQAIYFDVRSRMVQVRGLEPGDILVLEYRIAEVGERNLFEDYFGDVFFVEGEHSRGLVRHGTLMPPGRALHDNRATLGIGAWSEETHPEGTLHVFEARDLPGVRWERLSAGGSERHRMLSVSTWADWDGLADWYWNLIRHQLVTSPALEARVAELVEGRESTRDIVEAIHAYVVRTTRYVSLAFGVHGFRPYRTTEAFERRFGDCKDSASLMKVMLDLAGVHSETVLIRTRDLGRIADLPPSLHVFNHMILYVPELDLFLDGTAGHSGLDELPTMDQGGSALIVHDGEGGTFLEVPALPASASLSEQHVRVDLRAAPATAAFEATWSGSFAPWLRRAYESPDRRAERFAQSLARLYPGAEVEEVSFEGLEDITRPVHIRWETRGGNWLQEEGAARTLRLPPGQSGTLAERLLTGSERRSTLVLEHRWTTNETWEFVLPPGVGDLQLPDAGEVAGPFGRGALEVEREGDILRVRMEFVLDAFRVSPDEYSAFRAFVEAVDALLQQPIRWQQGEES